MEFIKSFTGIYNEASKVGKVIMIIGVSAMVIIGIIGIAYAAMHPSL